MSLYEKIFKKPYPGGWKNKPVRSTPITGSIMDNYDAAIEHIETGMETFSDEWENKWSAFEEKTINGVPLGGVTDNIELPSGKRWWVGSNNANSAGWYKFLTILTMPTNESLQFVLSVVNIYGQIAHGMVHIALRGDSNAQLSIAQSSIQWMYTSNMSEESIMAIADGSTVDFYVNQKQPQYGSIQFQVVSEGLRTAGIEYTTYSYGGEPVDLSIGDASLLSKYGGTVYRAINATYADYANGCLALGGGTMEEDAEVVIEKTWTEEDTDGNSIQYKTKVVVSKQGVTTYYWDSDSNEYEKADLVNGELVLEDYDGIVTRLYGNHYDTKNSDFQVNVRHDDGTNQSYWMGISGFSTNISSNLGSSYSKWKNIYATNGTIQTSDRNEKNHIADMTAEQAEALIYGLKPSTYQMNSGTSGRTHWGLISQDIEELLNSLGWDSLDFAGFIKSPKVEIEETVDEKGRVQYTEKVIEGEYTYSLRYDEFVAPLIKVVQEQNSKINSLEERLAKVEEKLN